MIKIEKFTFIIFFTLICIGFYWGFTNTLPSISRSKIVDYNKFANFQLTFKILLHNSLLGVLILLGFVSFNISNLLIFFYNGLVIGITYKSNFILQGHIKTIALIFTHGFFELYSFYLLFKLSIILNQLIINHIKSNNFINDFNSRKPAILNNFKKAIFFLTISSIIETYITPFFL
jgi:uncharacterized membrane protein SpoIIM required for sporulation